MVAERRSRRWVVLKSRFPGDRMRIYPSLLRGCAGNRQGLQVGIAAAMVEGQQRRVLQREHGEGRQQGVPKVNGRPGLPMVGDLGEALAHQGIKGISRQLLANLPGTGRRREDHGDSFRLKENRVLRDSGPPEYPIEAERPRPFPHGFALRNRVTNTLRFRGFSPSPGIAA